jgi:hypothetical protein
MRKRPLAALSNQTPFVAMIDVGCLYGGEATFQWHFVAPLATVQHEVIFHDPADGPDRCIRLDEFVGAWAAAGYRGVRLWMP